MLTVVTDKGVESNSRNLDFVNKVAMQNVYLTITKLKADSPVLNEMIKAGKIAALGATYQVKSGKVSFI